MKKLFVLLLTVLCLALCTAAVADELQAPTDFVFNTETGEFTFQSNDSNAGYYFIRIYSLTADGNEVSAYTASSKRINAGKAGLKKGKVDVSAMAWGAYHIKLVTFAASSTGYTAPAPVILTANYGIGGTLERPELMAVADGNQVELSVDWYSISDYYEYQYLPKVVFNIYSDEALTALAFTDTVDLAKLLDTIDRHPAGGYVWGYSTSSPHPTLDRFGIINDLYTYTLPAGTYYVTAQALSNDETVVDSSKPSEAVAFTLTDEEPNGEFTVAKSSLWQNPTVMGVPTAIPGQAAGRVDAAQEQTTTSAIAE